jgi:nicotinamidase-related amidase
MMGRLEPRDDDVLLLVDLQNDFCPGGALVVPGGDEVIVPCNQLARHFQQVVLTQDWHPPGHRSFASAHQGRSVFETIELDYGEQTLWPDHCVQHTAGAAFHERLDVPHAARVLRKGMHEDIDSYSAFFENDHRTPTGLGSYLAARGVRRVVMAGLALDYCVYWSALDARQLGHEVVVVRSACRAIDLDHSLERALTAMQQAGVVFCEL